MNEQPDDFTDSRARYADAARIFDEFHDAAGLTTIHFGIESVGAAHLSQQLTFAREHGVMSCIHINARNDIAQLRTHDLLGPDLLAIHGNLITDLELDAMAQVRMPLCFTPSADVQGTPADVVRRARLRDVPLVYGCDVPCHVASDTLQQLRYLFHVQGYIDGTVARSRAPVDTRRPAPGEAMPLLRPRDLLRSATIDAATVLGMDKRTGSIAVGKRADIVLVRKDEYGGASGDPCAYVLLQASARHIDTVMVDGEIRVKGGRVVDFDAQRARHLAHEARKRLIGAT